MHLFVIYENYCRLVLRLLIAMKQPGKIFHERIIKGAKYKLRLKTVIVVRVLQRQVLGLEAVEPIGVDLAVNNAVSWLRLMSTPKIFAD